MMKVGLFRFACRHSVLDAGDARVGEAAQQRIVQSLIRREFAQLFLVGLAAACHRLNCALPALKDKSVLSRRFNLDAGLKDGGLQWARLQLRDDVNADANTDASAG
jgi:hypothetical protein